jgi:hypothetical protein
MPSHSFTVKLVIPLNRRWASLQEHGLTGQILWDYYAVDAWDEEIFAGAILVALDGVPWNTVEHSEYFTHLECWLSATAVLVEGQNRSDVWAFEESGMEMRREGNAVVLEERTHHKHMQLKPVRLNLREFAQALMIATASAKEIMNELKDYAAKECGPDWPQLSIKWGESVGPNEVRLMSHEEFERQKTLGQKSEAERQRAMLLGYKPVGRPKDRLGLRIADILSYLREERFTSSWDRLASSLQRAI